MNMVSTIDAMWTLKGDIVKSNNNGIETTKGYPFLANKQVIRNRLLASKESWIGLAQMAASLDTVIGETNDKSTAKKIEQQIKLALTYDGFCSVSDVEVKAFPISMYSIAVRIKIKAEKDGKPYSIYETVLSRSKALGGVSIIQE